MSRRCKHVFGARTVGACHSCCNHGDRQLGGIGKLARFRQTHLGVLGQHVTAVPQGQVQPIEASRANLAANIGHRKVSEVIREKNEFHVLLISSNG